MHTLKLLLRTTRQDDAFLASVFSAITNVHNEIVEEGKKRLRMLKRDKHYRYARGHYGACKKNCEGLKTQITALEKSLDGTDDDNACGSIQKKLGDRKTNLRKVDTERKQFKEELQACMAQYGMAKSTLEVFATQRLNKKYKGILNSQQIQVEADRVWTGIEKVLYQEGKNIHYKKYRDIRSVRGKQNSTGFRFDKTSLSVRYGKNSIPIAYREKLETAAAGEVEDKDLSYKLEALSGKIRYCEIIREEFNDGYHYYANLYIEGDAPKELIPGNGRCGIDPGVSTVAAVSEEELFLEELVPEYKKYDKSIFKLQRKADKLRRELNPEYYKEDGTIIKQKPHEKRVWKTSPVYVSVMRMIRILYRKKKAYTATVHAALCNRIIKSADVFRVEAMDFPALAKRAKETRRADTVTTVTKADGTTQEIRKFKCKKRFGKSITSRSPGLFLDMLKRKCSQYGLDIRDTDTRQMKASQYDHTSDTYQKHPLKERTRTLSDSSVVQRDLYSAFLQQHADEEGKHPDRISCIRDFPSFKARQDALLARMKAEGISMKQCFGF